MARRAAGSAGAPRPWDSGASSSSAPQPAPSAARQGTAGLCPQSSSSSSSSSPPPFLLAKVSIIPPASPCTLSGSREPAAAGLGLGNGWGLLPATARTALSWQNTPATRQQPFVERDLSIAYSDFKNKWNNTRHKISEQIRTLWPIFIRWGILKDAVFVAGDSCETWLFNKLYSLFYSIFPSQID